MRIFITNSAARALKVEKGTRAIFTIPRRLQKTRKEEKKADIPICPFRVGHTLRLELKATAYTAQETWVRFTVTTNPARAR